MESQKFCSDCGVWRPASAFTKDRRQRDGLAFYCRDHARQRMRESRVRRVGRPQTRRLTADQVIPDGSKWCPDCGTVKPVWEFPRSRANASGRGTYCRPCHNARGRATLERKGGSREYHLQRRYGIGADDANAMLEAQGGLCAVCGTAPAVHVDHDHASGRVRAILCFNCNGGLGQFKDDPAALRAAADYVEFHRARQAEPSRDPVATSRPTAPRPPVASPVGSGRRRRRRLPADRLCSRGLFALALEAEAREAAAREADG
jgi:hypothetical protein